MNKLSLSASRQRLVEKMQHINFGRIEHLTVIDGEPFWETGPPRIVQSILIGKDSKPSQQCDQLDFNLKKQIIELFEFFDQERDLRIDRIDVQNGLPVRVLIAT